ncbi:hypothetical protein EVAR_898_1 [Eumeta japonica]|uniref:Uncharacterized protein n=1 Tax=Eumeta variegata TaxID=151549 RepID=A0A4C1SE33_EUMVA|nr:hypothetical protein EVAR_898_1 [Eumeta japonica]
MKENIALKPVCWFSRISYEAKERQEYRNQSSRRFVQTEHFSLSELPVISDGGYPFISPPRDTCHGDIHYRHKVGALSSEGRTASPTKSGRRHQNKSRTTHPAAAYVMSCDSYAP